MIYRKSPIKERGESVPAAAQVTTSASELGKGRKVSASDRSDRDRSLETDSSQVSPGAKNRGRSSPPAIEPKSNTAANKQLIEENRQLKVENMALKNELLSIKKQVKLQDLLIFSFYLSPVNELRKTVAKNINLTKTKSSLFSALAFLTSA